MQHQWDLLVIGAGPAGLNTASAAAENGLDVLLIDEQDTPGGQIYRNLSVPRIQERFVNVEERQNGLGIINRFLASGADYKPKSTVWYAEPGRVICSRDHKSMELKAQCLAIATGAMERPVPFRGWTLPGVMNVGACDIMYKNAGITPSEPIVIAGSGPLILPVACHLLALKVPVAAILDMTPFKNRFSALATLPKALSDFSLLLKGRRLLKKVKTSGVPIFYGVKTLEAKGQNRLETVCGHTARKHLSFSARTLLCHFGVIPRTHLTRQLKLEHGWNRCQRYRYPITDNKGKSSNERLYVVGDGSSVHGAAASACMGSQAGIDIALQLNMISKTEARLQSKSAALAMKKALAPRPFVDAWFAPSPDWYRIKDNVTVCRCEGIRAGAIRGAVKEACHHVNEIKIRTRCGMGRCQGRMCETAMAEIAALHLGADNREMGALSIRPPIRPVPLREICNVDHHRN